MQVFRRGATKLWHTARGELHERQRTKALPTLRQHCCCGATRWRRRHHLAVALSLRVGGRAHGRRRATSPRVRRREPARGEHGDCARLRRSAFEEELAGRLSSGRANGARPGITWIQRRATLSASAPPRSSRAPERSRHSRTPARWSAYCPPPPKSPARTSYPRSP